MKKGNTIVIGLVMVIILAVGGFLLFHKSDKSPATNTGTSKATTAAVNNAVLTTKTDATIGQYLADPSGKALYTYSGDTSGVSNCSGSCLRDWPAYVATSSTTSLPSGVSTIKRSDNGQTQYTYNGLPLYYFVSDSVGKVTGNGVSGFKVAVPAASSPSSSASDNSSSSNQYNY